MSDASKSKPPARTEASGTPAPDPAAAARAGAAGPTPVSTAPPAIAAVPAPGTAAPVAAVTATSTAPATKAPLSYTQKVMIAVGISAAAVLLAFLLYYTTDILVLCFAGLLFAVFISAPADLLAKYTRIQRNYALALVLLALASVVLGGGYFMGYTVTRQARELNRTLPGALVQFANDMEERFTPRKPYFPESSESLTPAATETATTSAPAGSQSRPASPATLPPGDTGEQTATATPPPRPLLPHYVADKLSQIRQATVDFFFSKSFVDRAGGVAGGVVSSTFGIIGNVVVVLGLGLFFAFNPRLYSQGLVLLVPISRRGRAAHILAEVGMQLQWWFVGQLCSMVSIAFLTFLGLSILRIPMAITLAILAGLMNFIPNFGPLLAAAPAVLIAFAPQGDHASLNPARAGWVILMYVIIQLLEGWVITPYFQKRAVELPAALIILSQVVFALLLGPLGLVLATPILAASLVIVRMLYVEDILGDRTHQPHHHHL